MSTPRSFVSLVNKMPGKQALNVLGTPLQKCSKPEGPITGFFRDGYCNSSPDLDVGKHTIAGIVTDEFLAFSKSKGNDLSTPRPHFPGLKNGTRWCLCQGRWLEAYQARLEYGEQVVPRVVLAATHQNALDSIPLEVLRRYAVDDDDSTAAIGR